MAAKQRKNFDSRHLCHKPSGADQLLELVARGHVGELVVRLGDVQEEVAVFLEESDGVGAAEEDVGGGDAARVGGR